MRFTEQEEMCYAESANFPVSIFTVQYDDSIEYSDYIKDRKYFKIGYTLKHWHRRCEIIYVDHGDLEIKLNDKQMNASTGDIILINGFDTHFLRGTGVSMVWQFDFPIQNELWQPNCMYLEISDEKKVVHRGDGLYDKLYNEFHDARAMYIGKQKDYRSAIIACVAKFVYYANQIEPDFKRDSEEGRRKSVEYCNIKSLFSHIDQNYGTNISISSAAALLGLTPNYFCRYFKKFTGMTFFEYLKEFRCEKAENLLQQTDKSITEIALETGFSSSQYFCRVYKEYRGYSPSKARKIERQ